MNIEKKLLSPVLTAAFILSLALLLAACEQEGPMERAGEEIDEAVAEVDDSAEDAVEEIGDSAEEAADEVEEEIDAAKDG